MSDAYRKRTDRSRQILHHYPLIFTFSTSPLTDTALPYTDSVYSFIETRLFTRLVQDYLGDDEFRRLQIALLENPEAGDIIPGSGGIRKVPWRAPDAESEAVIA